TPPGRPEPASTLSLGPKNCSAADLGRPPPATPGSRRAGHAQNIRAEHYRRPIRFGTDRIRYRARASPLVTIRDNTSVPITVRWTSWGLIFGRRYGGARQTHVTYCRRRTMSRRESSSARQRSACDVDGARDE